MDSKILSYFYKFNGIKNEFCKVQFIRLIRNKIIDPNTKIILSHGFEYFDKENEMTVRVPCDDANWNEYLTFNEGLKNDILSFPFTMKLYHDYFLNFNSYNDFYDLFSLVVKFRTETIKHGWAIKYGISYKDTYYEPLEDLNENKLINWKDPRRYAKITLDMLTEDDFDIR